MTLTDGMNVARVRQVGAQLRATEQRLDEVCRTGRAGLATLDEAWQGPDLASFGDRWSAAERVVHAAADQMRAYADELERQADAQDSASDSPGGRGPGGPGGPAGPGGRDGGAGGADDAGAGGSTKEKDNPNFDPDAEDAVDTEIEGPLFRDGVAPTDVEQGSLNDCWFIASLQAVAATHPEVLEQGVVDNGDGTYDVTLYVDGEPVVYRVDAVVPADDGDPVFADNASASDRELWPLLYEKAMAQHMGGDWRDLDYDTAQRALEAITGQDVDTENTSSGIFDWNAPPDSDEIREVLDTGGQVLLSSHDDVGGRPLYEDDTIATNHLYWVSGVTDSGDLELTNPWSPGDDPIVLTYEEFQDNFGHISTSRP